MNFHVGLERSFKLCASRRSQNEEFLPSFENLNYMFYSVKAHGLMRTNFFIS